MSDSSPAEAGSSAAELPEELKFNGGHLINIVIYSLMFIVSAVGNLTVLTLLVKRRGHSSKSRINAMLIHLAIADLLVTFLMMPWEIIWNITVSWFAGALECKIMAFFRVFGLYLSSFTLICISIDRYHAVMRPLQMLDIDRRGTFMLSCSWIGAIICSTPNAIIYQLESHPNFTHYQQCATFSLDHHKQALYFIFNMFMMYLVPLAVIVFSYTSILAEMFKRSKDFPSDKIRRSSMGFLGRARIRTLKMTITIVLAFILCWTPYYIMSIIFFFDKESAKAIDEKISKALYTFACTNSCMNPIVYGIYNIRKAKKNTTESQKNRSSKGSGTETQIHHQASSLLQGQQSSHRRRSDGEFVEAPAKTQVTLVLSIASELVTVENKIDGDSARAEVSSSVV